MARVLFGDPLRTERINEAAKTWPFSGYVVLAFTPHHHITLVGYGGIGGRKKSRFFRGILMFLNLRAQFLVHTWASARNFWSTFLVARANSGPHFVQ